MKEFICSNCGSKDFYTEGSYRICRYCRSRFLITKEDVAARTSTIDLSDDVQRLLNKCQSDPTNARRYANLVLDIDPGNMAARKILKEK